MIQARIAGRRGDYEKAKGLLTFAFNRASTWPRACIRAAQVAVEIDQPVLAAKYLALALDRSPAWIPKTIGNGTFACLVHDRTFHRWISPDLQKDAMVDYRKAQASKESSGADCLVLAERLLEVGYGTAALAVRENAVSSSPDVILLRATARADQGNLPAAVKQVDAGLKLNPGDARLKLRLARLPC